MKSNFLQSTTFNVLAEATPKPTNPLYISHNTTPITMSSRDLGDAPSGDVQDNSYVSRPGEKHQPIPVQSDGMKVEDPVDANTADSDRQLGMAYTTPLSRPY